MNGTTDLAEAAGRLRRLAGRCEASGQALATREDGAAIATVLAAVDDLVSWPRVRAGPIVPGAARQEGHSRRGRHG